MVAKPRIMQIRVHRLHRHAIAPKVATQLAGEEPCWELACPRTFEVTWNGGSEAEDLEIKLAEAEEDEPPFVVSELGHGVLTFHAGCQIKTTEPYSLWLGAPAGSPKDGIAPIERLLDTAQLPGTVTVHWQLTRPHETIRFAAGESFARLRLHPGSGTGPLELVRAESDETSALEQEVARLAEAGALDAVFERLRTQPGPGAAAPEQAESPASGSGLPFGCFETIDGRLDLRSFEPDFFLADRFRAPFIDALRAHGQLQLRDYYLVDERRLAFLSVPKVACTAIKLALVKARGLAVPADKSLHQHVHVLPSWHREYGKLGPAQAGYHRFAFVRNPFDRLVSCYRSKILFQPTPAQSRPLYASYFFSLPTNGPFDDFARRIAKIPDALADGHFKSQYSLLYEQGRLMVDELGRFERFDADWRSLAERHGLEPVLEMSNESNRTAGGHGDYRHYYTEELVQLIYERYRRDVHTFGYQADYEELLAFARGR